MQLMTVEPKRHIMCLYLELPGRSYVVCRHETVAVTRQLQSSAVHVLAAPEQQTCSKTSSATPDQRLQQLLKGCLPRLLLQGTLFKSKKRFGNAELTPVGSRSAFPVTIFAIV